MNELKRQFQKQFYIEFLPKEPLVGIKILNRILICEDNNERPIFRIEIGFIFLIISYTNVNYNKDKSE